MSTLSIQLIHLSFFVTYHDYSLPKYSVLRYGIQYDRLLAKTRSLVFLLIN